MTTKLRADVTISVDGKSCTLGSYDSEGDVGQGTLGSLTGDVIHVTKTIAASSTALLWDQSVDPVSDFDFLALVSIGGDCEVEFTVADGGNEVNFVLKLVDGLPLLIPSDVSRDSAHTADWGADGAAAEIDKIQAKNFSTTTSVDVEMLLVG